MEKMETIRRLTRWKIARVTLIGLATVAGSNLIAQTEPTATRTFIYSAKYVCKDVPVPSTEPALRLGPAALRTVVNVHHSGDERIKVGIKVIEAHGLGNPNDLQAGRTMTVLQPMDAVFIDCRDIARILEDPIRASDGFVVIETDRMVDVTAVYTAFNRRLDAPSEGVSIDVESIQPRVRRAATPNDTAARLNAP